MEDGTAPVASGVTVAGLSNPGGQLACFLGVASALSAPVPARSTAEITSVPARKRIR